MAETEDVTERIAALPPLGEVIRDNGLDARRKLGQNFLLDLNLTGRIARAAGVLHGTVIEIGPGPGGLTRALLLAGAEKVIAIERDSRAITALAPLVEAAAGRLEVIQADALSVPVHLLGSEAKQRHIVANLPYNIATPLLFGWLDQVAAFTSMTLMFQREVAERITAAAGTAGYGRLSVMSQWLCEATMLFDIPPRAFVPPPKVYSSVIRLVPRPAPLADAEAGLLQEVTRLAFGQRRKMLRASLRSIGGEALLEAAGIAGNLRPETLQINQFCNLAEALRQQRS